jgi:hypothetical protein
MFHRAGWNGYNATGRRRGWHYTEGKYGDTRSDDGNAAQHGRSTCNGLFHQRTEVNASKIQSMPSISHLQAVHCHLTESASPLMEVIARGL